jgi:hypothetical protein
VRPPDTLARYRDALRLTEAFCAELRAGEEGDGEAFARHREEILAGIPTLPASPGRAGAADPVGAERVRRESAQAIERILALDREIVDRLEARKADIRRKLEVVKTGRRTLQSYRGPAPTVRAAVNHLG